jgi:hypothetical protein
MNRQTLLIHSVEVQWRCLVEGPVIDRCAPWLALWKNQCQPLRIATPPHDIPSSCERINSLKDSRFGTSRPR